MSDAAVLALRRIDETLFELPASARADMRVPARVFADAELLDAIRTVHAGDALLSPSITRRLIEHVATSAPSRARARSRI